MRYAAFCLLILIITVVFSAGTAVAQKCDVSRLMIENPNGYEDWMIEHVRKPDAATAGKVIGAVAAGETIVITAPLSAVGDVIFAATADCQVPDEPNLQIFDIRADSDEGDDNNLRGIS